MTDRTPKILSVSTSDARGGAAHAAYRIHLSQKALGIDSKMFVKEKHLIDNDIIELESLIPKNPLYNHINNIRNKLRNKIQHLRWRRYPNREPFFMSDLRGTDLHGALHKLDYDILHLHWINLRFVPLNSLPHNKPIVWTLHDSWSFCGICHYFLECNRYQDQCGSCPHLHSKDNKDLSHWAWKKKLSAYKKLDLHIVTPSRWLGDCAKQSSLLSRFPVTIIPNCLDTNIFRPIEPSDISPCWEKFQKATIGKKIILFGAVSATKDPIKGFSLLLKALQIIEQNELAKDIELAVFGADSSDLNIESGMPVHYLGYIHNTEELVSLYNIANVMVVPSLTEVFAQTASEALACELPVVAFRCTGIQDTVDHLKDGYLAEPYNPEDLANGILWCLNNNNNNRLGKAGREKVLKKYSPEVVGEKYKQLYLSVYEDYYRKSSNIKKKFTP